MDDADADDDGNNKGDSRNESNLCSPKMEVVDTFLLSNEEHRKQMKSLVADLNMRLIFFEQNDLCLEKFYTVL